MSNLICKLPSSDFLIKPPHNVFSRSDIKLFKRVI